MLSKSRPGRDKYPSVRGDPTMSHALGTAAPSEKSTAVPAEYDITTAFFRPIDERGQTHVVCLCPTPTGAMCGRLVAMERGKGTSNFAKHHSIEPTRTSFPHSGAWNPPRLVTSRIMCRQPAKLTSTALLQPLRQRRPFRECPSEGRSPQVPPRSPPELCKYDPLDSIKRHPSNEEVDDHNVAAA